MDEPRKVGRSKNCSYEPSPMKSALKSLTIYGVSSFALNIFQNSTDTSSLSVGFSYSLEKEFIDMVIRPVNTHTSCG
jgi:hypothetical protein